MVNGFLGFCEQFFLTYSDYYIIPVRINGNAIESYFSQLKYAGRGQLTAINYETAQAAVSTCKAVSANQPRESDYQAVDIDVCTPQLKKRKY